MLIKIDHSALRGIEGDLNMHHRIISLFQYMIDQILCESMQLTSKCLFNVPVLYLSASLCDKKEIGDKAEERYEYLVQATANSPSSTGNIYKRLVLVITKMVMVHFKIS
jgi:hypothetical protein